MNNLAPTFLGITLQLLDIMLPKRDFVFSRNSYHPGSIKTQERLWRGCGEQFLLDRSATRKPNDLKEFLKNYENKRKLFKLILDVWSSSSAAAHLQICNSVFLVHLKEKARWHLCRIFWRQQDFIKFLGEIICHVLFQFVPSVLTAVGAYDVASLRSKRVTPYLILCFSRFLLCMGFFSTYWGFVL